jgi:hypothetical protein
MLYFPIIQLFTPFGTLLIEHPTYLRKDLEGDAGILNETTLTSLGDISNTGQHSC